MISALTRAASAASSCRPKDFPDRTSNQAAILDRCHGPKALHPHALRRRPALHQGQWTSWAIGSWVCSGGAYSARMPSPRSVQLAPSSSVNQTPPVETAIPHPLRIARVDTNRCPSDPRRPPPLLAPGMIPQRPQHLPTSGSLERDVAAELLQKIVKFQ
jgi:hypothetical protein